MSRFDRTLPRAYFDSIYTQDPDPWRLADSDYERLKYAGTMDALPNQKYESALEVGCSIGVLTNQLAARCKALLAIDVSSIALDQARARCRQWPQVHFSQLEVPHKWPHGQFDLILLSEVVYYLDKGDVLLLSHKVRDSASAHMDIVLVHWLGETNYPLSGDDAAEHFIACSATYSRVLWQKRTDLYRLDVLRV